LAAPVDQQDVRALARRQGRDAQAATERHVADQHQRVAPVGQPEEALEAHGVVELPARVEGAVAERLDGAQLTGA
jgi:hypothetical protein